MEKSDKVPKIKKEINHHEIAYSIPKAELHIHIEGTLEPNHLIEIAKRNKIDYISEEEIVKKFHFNNLDDFLGLCRICCDVLQKEIDFEELMYNYLVKSKSQGLAYAEITFGAQGFRKKGISLETILLGYFKAITKAKKELDVNAKLIFCLDRGLTEEEGIEAINEFQSYMKNLKIPEYKDYVVAIGLACSETGNPPSKFAKAFKLAKDLGYKITCHCCEENHIPLEYIKEALEIIKVDRVDHGVLIYQTQELLDYVFENKVPLTACPVSNVKLKVFKELKDFPYKVLKENGIYVCFNTDDPSFFGGYIGDVYEEMGKTFDMKINEYERVALNSFQSSFLSKQEKEEYRHLVGSFIDKYYQ